MARSGTVRANGHELYFEVHGDGGPPLVLIMGIGYDSTLWSLAQVPALAQKFRVVIFDNRDAGRSSKAKGAYTIADMADDVRGLLDALDIERAHVLGLSMGGMIAQEFALRHARRLDRLVLSGCGAAPARSAFDPIRTWNWVKANDPGGEVFAGQQFTWLFSTAFLRNAQAVQRTAALLATNPNPMGAEAYDRQAQAYLKHDALDRLGGIEAPTLVLAGEQDIFIPPWICQEVASKIPRARFELIRGDGSSHVMPLERPDEFNQLVASFLLQEQGRATDPARDPAAIEKARARVAELKKMMADTAEARARRQREKPLYERLGGRDAIRVVVTDIVDLHFTEAITKPLTSGVDRDRLVTLVVEWLCRAAGGPEKYTGRDMVSAHAHLGMTDVHFVAAGDQIVRSLKKHNVPEPEIQEVMCAIIAHHDDVIR
jgi:pimeloyl-ACP methyl ester carboxylesterase